MLGYLADDVNKQVNVALNKNGDQSDPVHVCRLFMK